MYKKNESSCLHLRGDFLMHISVRIVARNDDEKIIIRFKCSDAVGKYNDIEKSPNVPGHNEEIIFMLINHF